MSNDSNDRITGAAEKEYYPTRAVLVLAKVGMLVGIAGFTIASGVVMGELKHTVVSAVAAGVMGLWVVLLFCVAQYTYGRNEDVLRLSLESNEEFNPEAVFYWIGSITGTLFLLVLCTMSQVMWPLLSLFLAGVSAWYLGYRDC